MTWFSKKKIGSGKTVFVGVSGGVDSSVSAALLRDQGYNVVGVFIKTWQPDWILCTWVDERRDAMRVCVHLEIPFMELDLETEYKQGVADYMIAEYAAGRTPNPDVMCNRTVKFGGFLDWALDHGADYIATGHYAQVRSCTTDTWDHQFIGQPGSGRSTVSTAPDGLIYQLVQGADPAKDQSYFLWTLTEQQLSKTLFPIGHLQKPDVRNLAKKYNLPTATKKDSQGICFIGMVDMKEFLKHYIKTNSGDVIDSHGNNIGHHDGSILYTLGERHGFTITEKAPDDRPYYVTAKDITHNTITVSQYPQTESLQNISNQYKLTDTYFRQMITDQNGETPARYTAQIRYHGEQKPCRIIRTGAHDYDIRFTETDYTLAPGQSVVVYDSDVCIGGGMVA